MQTCNRLEKKKQNRRFAYKSNNMEEMVGLVLWSILIQRFKYRSATRWEREHVRQLLSTEK